MLSGADEGTKCPTAKLTRTYLSRGSNERRLNSWPCRFLIIAYNGGSFMSYSGWSAMCDHKPAAKNTTLPACQLNAFLPDFLNSSKYNDICPKAAKPYSFCRTVVSSRWRRSTCGGSRQQYWEGQKIYREETWLCQKHFELQQNVSRTYPDIRLFQFCYDFCDTSSDHCDMRTILQRTKIGLHRKLFAVNDGWREANGLVYICINSDISWSELYDKVIQEFGKFNRHLSFVQFNSQFLRAT